MARHAEAAHRAVLGARRAVEAARAAHLARPQLRARRGGRRRREGEVGGHINERQPAYSMCGSPGLATAVCERVGAGDGKGRQA
eukprot:321685-Chlamydomonas_euryale.AAC.1